MIKHRIVSAGLLCALLASVVVAVKAQDDAPSKPTSDLLDRELLKELVPELPLDVPEDERESSVPLPDELDHAVTSMRSVTERLDQKDVSEETSRLQTSILDDLDKLIDRLKNQPPPQQNQNSDPDQNSQNQNRDPSDSQNQRPQQQGNSKPQEQPQAGDSSGQPQAGKSQESSEQNQRKASERAAAALARRRALINEVWGHLPPALRERLLNVQSEKLLPGYEGLIRRYYESLAETEDK